MSKNTYLPEKITATESSLSTERRLNYKNSSVKKEAGITKIQIDHASQTIDNTKTYMQNIVNKFALSGNKEVCIRKILIAPNNDLFDVTVRQINVYYRSKERKAFDKVFRFKSPYDSVEYVLEVLKNKALLTQLTKNNSNLLLN